VDRTLVICKPDAVERRLVGEIVRRFEAKGLALVAVVEGPEDTYKVVRLMVGATNPREAAPGTIRGDLAVERTENLVHASDSPESAAREIELFFPGLP
jgi:nucleoside-diphosphate kinase